MRLTTSAGPLNEEEAASTDQIVRLVEEGKKKKKDLQPQFGSQELRQEVRGEGQQMLHWERLEWVTSLI